MSENTILTDQNENKEPAPRRFGIGAVAVTAALVALGGLNAYLLTQNSALRREMHALGQLTQSDIAALQERATQQEAAMRQSMESLHVQVQATEGAATSAAERARASAQKHADKLALRLSEMQKQQSAEMANRLTEIKQENASNADRVSGLATDVGSVKTDVAHTKSTLDQTIADLKSVRGDLGVQSGLIATNARELAALRELGEHNYFEFTLKKSKSPHKIAGVALLLRKTDQKRNRYSLDLIADDRKVEKKDKYTNEPVQFYVNGTRAPLEIVVNQVGKDEVMGYLATPKVQSARR